MAQCVDNDTEEEQVSNRDGSGLNAQSLDSLVTWTKSKTLMS